MQNGLHTDYKGQEGRRSPSEPEKGFRGQADSPPTLTDPPLGHLIATSLVVLICSIPLVVSGWGEGPTRPFSCILLACRGPSLRTDAGLCHLRRERLLSRLLLPGAALPSTAHSLGTANKLLSRVVLLAGRIRTLEISIAAIDPALHSKTVLPATTMATPGANASALAADRLNSPVTIPAVMFIFGVVGNLVAIVVLCKSRKEQKETTFYTLVCGLAVTDLLGTLLVSPVTIATYMKGQWPGGPALCEYSTFILLFFGLSGLSIICAMSIERYLAINHAYFYNHYVDKRLAGLTLFAVYASNVLFCALPNMGLGSSRLQYPKTWCFIDWTTNVTAHAAFSYMYAGFSSFLILATVLCNVLVCGALLRMHRQFMRR
ncbi:hypothetical protein CB1_001954001 [Camelus ferus]|nr:hypothetical protein CB1_001954001 [Camelus ferus]